MIHYHGLPITPDTAAVEAIAGGHAFISYAKPGQLTLAQSICQSFAVDNGAFTYWKRGEEPPDWQEFYDWLDPVRRHPGFDFAVIPDVIDGTEEENDQLIDAWPFGRVVGAPVWHMHESVERLVRLSAEFPRGVPREFRGILSGWQ